LLCILLVAAAYAVSGKLGLLLAIPPGYATAVWPASGVALAGVLLWGYRTWPGILLGSFLVNVSTSWDPSTPQLALRSLLLASAIGMGAASQALIGGWLIRRWTRFRNIFHSESEVIRFLLVGGPLSCIVNATIGTGSLWTAGLIPQSNLLFNWWTWWVGDSIGVLIFTPLICAWSLRPYAQWRRQQIALSLPMGVVFAAVVALFFYVSAGEQRRLTAEFEGRVQGYGAALQKAIDTNLQMLTTLRSFYAASERVERQEFNAFVSGLLPQYPAVQTVGWAPRVEAEGLDAFEKAMRDGGRPGYRVYDTGTDGRVMAPTARATYFPIAFVTPEDGNGAVLGFDITSEPLRRDAVERALQTHRPAASQWIHLVQDVAPRPSTILYLPIYAGAAEPLGVATAALRLDDVLQVAFKGLGQQGLHARVFDGPGPAEPAAFLVSPGSLPPADKIASRRSIPIRVADRVWTVEFLLPDEYLIAHRSWQAWGLLAAGLLLAALLGMLLLVLLARQSRIEEVVHSRTAELRETEQRFRGLLEAAPDAILIVDDGGRIDLVNRQTEQLFGYARDEIVGMNIDQLVPERFRRQHASHRTHYVGDPRARQMGAGLDLCARRKDGTEFPVEISLGPREIGSRMFTIAMARDEIGRASCRERVS
jgi:PAS domain S-box-containing protein